MNVLIVEPYLTKSHEYWMNGLKEHLPYPVLCLDLPARFWKWRMHGAAITLANRLREKNWIPDCMILSDMMDVALFLALTRDIAKNCSSLLYFHESQLTYPISDYDLDSQRQFDNHYPFINYTSALSVDQVIFNSRFHHQVFFEKLEPFLRDFPDYNKDLPVRNIRQKSRVVYPGIDVSSLDRAHCSEKNSPPIILWNHRWEYDKNPEVFFEMLSRLKQQGLKFRLCILGQSFSSSPAVFNEAKEKFSDEIIQFGYEEDDQLYYQWLWRSDIVVSTADQEFFGISILEAMYCRCFPLLPNRLVYPEHIPSGLSKLCLYENADDLFNKAIWTMKHLEDMRSHLDNIQQRTAQYEIANCAAMMSDLIEELATKKEKGTT
ncbi:MAG: DUF3524 domain-containing protein [Saprospiraceae bacterium]|nr:DUF3524 domain-containing protein [Saprospiraceae bacterium]